MQTLDREVGVAQGGDEAARIELDTPDRLKGLEVVMTEIGRRRRSFADAFKLQAAAAVRGGRGVARVAARRREPISTATTENTAHWLLHRRMDAQ